MNIENQVCTIEQAKKLFDLGVKGFDSAQYYWVDYSTYSGHSFALSRPLLHGDKSWLIVQSKISEELQKKLDDESLNAAGPIYPAINVAEFGELLKEVDNGNIDVTCFYNWHMGFWDCVISRPNDETPEMLSNNFECETEAEVRADALIWLIENGHLAIDYCNSILCES